MCDQVDRELVPAWRRYSGAVVKQADPAQTLHRKPWTSTKLPCDRAGSLGP